MNCALKSVMTNEPPAAPLERLGFSPSLTTCITLTNSTQLAGQQQDKAYA